MVSFPAANNGQKLGFSPKMRIIMVRFGKTGATSMDDWDQLFDIRGMVRRNPLVAIPIPPGVFAAVIGGGV